MDKKTTPKTHLILQAAAIAARPQLTMAGNDDDDDDDALYKAVATAVEAGTSADDLLASLNALCDKQDASGVEALVAYADEVRLGFPMYACHPRTAQQPSSASARSPLALPCNAQPVGAPVERVQNENTPK